MLLAGNDVVDLRSARLSALSRNPRFFERVFTAAEQMAIRSADDPFVMTWLLWAAKEASFKIACKIDPATVFAHRKFRISVRDFNPSAARPGFRASVIARHEEMETEIFVAGDPEKLHAVGMSGEIRPADACWFWGEEIIGGNPPELRQSAAVRAGLIRDVSSRTKTAVSRWEVVRPKAAKAPPRLLFDGMPSGFDISLSHDGRWAGWMAGVKNSEFARIVQHGGLDAAGPPNPLPSEHMRVRARAQEP